MQEDFNSSKGSDVSPLATFQADDLMEKLKLLNYERQLLREFKMKPLSRFYFVKSVNPGEQFYMFTLICWWLCQKLGKTMDRPQESDDPNTVIANIVQKLEEMDVPVDFQPNKLIRGAGVNCLQVLDCLATQVFKVGKISCQRFQIEPEEEMATDYLDDNAEIILEKLEDETMLLSDDSDMEMDAATFKNLNWIGGRGAGNNNLQNNSEAPEGFTDQQQWRLEFERVMPHLKVIVKADARDWRSHLSQMSTLRSNIEEISEATQVQLKKLYSEFTFSLEKIESREKHLNNELQPLIKQFKEVSIELSSVQLAQTQVQADSERMLAQLDEVIGENETKKREMEQRGQSMSDGSSVLLIKKAILRLREDVAQLTLEVALLVHAIDQDIVRQTGSFGDGEVGTSSTLVGNAIKSY